MMDDQDFEAKLKSVLSHHKLLDILLNQLNPSNPDRKNVTSFRPKQLEALKIVSEHNDMTAVLPTGYGKSLIFEMIPYITQRAIIIASPLDSIICEQVQRFGTDAILVNSNLLAMLRTSIDTNGDATSDDYSPDNLSDNDSLDDKSSLLTSVKKLRTGDFKYLLGHPECLTSATLKKELSSVGEIISHLVVDEAHCIVSWGQSNFRPEFLSLRSLRSFMPHCSVIALTATATKKVQEEIAKALNMQNYKVVSYLPDRGNVFLEVKVRSPLSGGENTAEDSVDKILEPIIQQLKTEQLSFPKTIVYTSLPYCAHGHDLSTRILKVESGPVAQYHSPQTQAVKKDLVTRLCEPQCETRLLFATEAYGMGTDVPDIRRILHIGPPSSIETYIQEFGRAGRDGNSATATLYFNKSDIGKNKLHIDDSIREYCVLDTCRRVYLMDYFGYTVDVILPKHNCCDNCAKSCYCDECVMIREVEDVVNNLHQPRRLSKEGNATGFAMLTYYFQEENKLLTTTTAPEAVTGLSESLAWKLLEDIDNFYSVENLAEKFPNIKTAYLVNIFSLLQKISELFLNNNICT